jgi:hypothetical protein
MIKQLTKFRSVNQIRFPQCEPNLQASCSRGNQKPCVLCSCTVVVAAVQEIRIRREEGMDSAGNLISKEELRLQTYAILVIGINVIGSVSRHGCSTDRWDSHGMIGLGNSVSYHIIQHN